MDTITTTATLETAKTGKPITENSETEDFGISNGLVSNSQQFKNMELETLDEGPKAKFRQFYSAGVAHLGAFIMATVWSYSSTALPSLRESGESLGEITIWTEAWIASITFLAGAAGSPVTGYIAQTQGLKRSLVIATIPLLIGWLLIAFAQNTAMILVGRFLTGFFVAGVGVSNSLIGELSKPSRRGRLNFGFDMLFCVGVLFIYVIGTFFSWRVQARACASICVLFFALLLTIPESPLHLIRNKNEAKARKGLKWIRDSTNVNAEVTTFIKNIEEEASESRRRQPQGGWTAEMATYFSKATFKPTFLAVALQFFLQVCGVVPIVCYAVDVFKAAGNEGVNENVSTIILGVVNLGATCIAYLFVDKYGRRPLFLISEAFLTVTLVILGAFLFAKNSLGIAAFQTASWSWFPLFCFVVYIAAYSFGVGPLPWVLMGEILPPNAKGFANGVVTLAARVFGFLVMFFFKDMIEIIGQHGVYWFFGIVCFLGFIFCYFLIPETRGQTLDDVQTIIQENWFHNRKAKPVFDENFRPNGHV